MTTTPIGKITLDVCQDESASDRLTFRILDTGNGVSANEIDNMHFPYLNETQSDLYGKANAPYLLAMRPHDAQAGRAIDH